MKPNHTCLSIDFESVAVNDQTMSLWIIYRDQVWRHGSMPEGSYTWTHNIELPARVSLIFGGRSDRATLVDSNNNIVKNQSCRINSVRFDGLPVWSLWTEHCVITELDDSDDVIIGATVCANGRVDLIFDQATAFECLVTSKLQ